MNRKVEAAVGMMLDISALSGDWEAPEVILLQQDLRALLESLSAEERLQVNHQYSMEVIGKLLPMMGGER